MLLRLVRNDVIVTSSLICKFSHGNVNPVNQPEKFDQSDSFLPSKILAYKTSIFFSCWLNKCEIKYIVLGIRKKSLAELFPVFLSVSGYN